MIGLPLAGLKSEMLLDGLIIAIETLRQQLAANPLLIPLGAQPLSADQPAALLAG